MKRLLPVLFICMHISNSHKTIAQITSPAMKANFGIEADTRANFYNGLVTAAGDDWFNKSAGAGQQVIDTTGAAAILAGYTSNPATRMRTFSRLMHQAPYTTVSNRILLDAVFHRDFHGSDSTVYAAGSNKNGMSAALWSCPIAQNIPDKNDILDATIHVRRAGPNVTDSLWMFGGISIENTTGSRYFDFELYQTDISYNRTTRTFSGMGPDAGHTSWEFDASGNIIKAGDIIFTGEYSSASLTLIEARIWVPQTALSVTPTAFSWGGAFDGDGSGATFGYASIVPRTAGAFYSGLQSGNGVWAGPFGLVQQDNSLVTDFVAKQYMEFSVNLTKLGIDPAAFSTNPCGSPYRRVLIKTRASTSFTAELKDFIAPFRMFDYLRVDAYAPVTYYCGSMPTLTLNLVSPYASSNYTWSTTNGNITSSTTGSSITVNAPGTYYVSQKLHVQCPVYATDSITIVYDPVCTYLDVNLLNFTASMADHSSVLKWQATNNQLVDHYSIEYSLDNSVYNEVTDITSIEQNGTASYNFSHPIHLLKASIVFYRIKVVGKSGLVKYSNIVSVKTGIRLEEPVLYPNPTVNEVYITLQSEMRENLDIIITDSHGKLVERSSSMIKKGENKIKLIGFSKYTRGIYFMHLKSGEINSTQQLILK